jgi:hypothetical protein
MTTHDLTCRSRIPCDRQAVPGLPVCATHDDADWWALNTGPTLKGLGGYWLEAPAAPEPRPLPRRETLAAAELAHNRARLDHFDRAAELSAGGLY